MWPRKKSRIQKALRGALSGPGPQGTPANGGWDRNLCPFLELFPILSRGRTLPTKRLLISGLQKGPAEMGHVKKTSKIVKKCQKVFRHFSTIFAQGKKTSKFFDNFRAGHHFTSPFWGGSEQGKCSLHFVFLMGPFAPTLFLEHFCCEQFSQQ